MKRALLAATAILSSAIVNTPANAAVTVLDTVTAAGADTATLAAMQGQCTAQAAAHGTAWHGTLDEGSIQATWVSGPTEVGTHTFAADGVGDQTGAGTFTPAHTDILGDPYRIGGSVNMFGIQEAVGGSYSASSYDFNGTFSSTYAYSFDCEMSETVHVPVQGYYVVDPSAPGDSATNRGNCDAFTALGPDASQPWWGTNQAFCDFVTTVAAHDEDQDRPDEAGTPVNQDQTDTLLAHEDNGEGFSTSDTLLIGQVAVCISPSKPTPGGTWKTQNGYTGSDCTTTYFNSAPWGAGSQDSNGTYVSVPVV